MVERQVSTASAPPLLQRGDSSGDSFRDDVQMSIGRHTEDATLRLPNAYLMQRGRRGRTHVRLATNTALR